VRADPNRARPTGGLSDPNQAWQAGGLADRPSQYRDDPGPRVPPEITTRN
jgi:hypothetical protein